MTNIRRAQNGLDLSIIIISFNTGELLRKCIRSVLETVKNITFEIIVVDNGSSDGTLNMLAKDFPDVLVLKNSMNFGFAKANNQAIGISQGRMILLLNSDTVVRENAVETLFRFVQDSPSIAAAGPKVLNMDGSLQSMGAAFPFMGEALLSLFRIPRLIPMCLRKRFFPASLDRGPDEPRPVGWVTGCCMMIRTEVLERIGLLDEDFYFYFEETEWCFRARRSGYRIYCVPQAEIFHYGGASKIDQPALRLTDSMSLLYRKCFGRTRGIIILLLAVLSSITSLCPAMLRSNETEISHLREVIRKNIFLVRRILGDK